MVVAGISQWDWTETFDVNTGFSQLGSRFTVDSGGNNKLVCTGISSGDTAYIVKSIPDGNILSGTLATYLAEDCTLTSATYIPSPLYHGATNTSINWMDLNDTSGIVALFDGCGGTNLGDHGASKEGTTAVKHSSCWGGSKGTPYWDTIFILTATTAQSLVYSDSARTTNVFDTTWTIDSMGDVCDRWIATSVNAGVPSRTTDAEMDGFTMKSGINEE